MSFGKAKTPRFAEPLHKVDVPVSALRNSISRTSISSQRSFSQPPCTLPKPTPRSRSLSRAKSSVQSSTNISVTTTNTAGKSKIPIQSSKASTSPATGAVATGYVSPGDKNKHTSQNIPQSPVSTNKSTTSTTPAKAIRAAKCSQNTLAGVKPSFTITTASNISDKATRTGPSKKRLGSPNRETSSPRENKETTKLTAAPVISNETKNLNQKRSIQFEEIIQEINLNCGGERKIFEKVHQPEEVSFNLSQFKELLSFIPHEGITFSSHVIENRKTVLTNLINNYIDSKKDNLQNEKIANYLEEGDVIHKKCESIKQSHHDICEKLFSKVKDLLSETLSLRSLTTDLRSKLDLLETENTDMCKQMKAFSDELENEREKIAFLNQRKTLLEQQIKTTSKRLKELEDKSQNCDTKVSHQSSQIKAYESQLKQKDEKYHMLEQRYNHQAKQCKAAIEMRDKMEKQQESFEDRLNDLKKEKFNQQHESTKVIEALKNQLNTTLKELDDVRNQKNNLEKELEETNEILTKTQEKSLELADVTEISKAAIINEVNSLPPSEKEACILIKLNEVQSSLDKANADIEHFKEENDRLRTTVFQSLEKTAKNYVKDAESTLVNILKKDLTKKDDIIEKLQKQVDTYMREAEERTLCIKESLKNQSEPIDVNDKNKAAETEAALKYEMQILNQRLEDEEAQNRKLKNQLGQKQLEVEQRDRVMQEQTKVLHVRDELLRLLRQKENVKADQANLLQTNVDDHEFNAELVSKFFTEKAEKLQGLYSTFEMRQRKTADLQEEIKQYEEQQKRSQKQRTRLEARIAELEMALHEKTTTTYIPSNYCARGRKIGFM